MTKQELTNSVARLATAVAASAGEDLEFNPQALNREIGRILLRAETDPAFAAAYAGLEAAHATVQQAWADHDDLHVDGEPGDDDRSDANARDISSCLDDMERRMRRLSALVRRASAAQPAAPVAAALADMPSSAYKAGTVSDASHGYNRGPSPWPKSGAVVPAPSARGLALVAELTAEMAGEHGYFGVARYVATARSTPGAHDSRPVLAAARGLLAAVRYSDVEVGPDDLAAVTRLIRSHRANWIASDGFWHDSDSYYSYRLLLDAEHHLGSLPPAPVTAVAA